MKVDDTIEWGILVCGVSKATNAMRANGRRSTPEEGERAVKQWIRRGMEGNTRCAKLVAERFISPAR